MALMCDRCDARDGVETKMVQVAQPGFLVPTIMPGALQVDLCRHCAVELTKVIKAFVHNR